MEEGRGNVFADLGLTNPEERLAKADLAIRIGEAIRARHLTQTRTAHILKIDQPKISRLLRGQLSGFSTERLMHFLTLLGRDVEITVKRTPPGASRRRRQRLTLLHLELVGTVQEQRRENYPSHLCSNDKELDAFCAQAFGILATAGSETRGLLS